MKLKELGQKVKETDYKKLFGTKTFIIVSCITLAAVALLVGALVNGNAGVADPVGTESGGKTLGNPVLVDNNVSDVEGAIANGEDYFAVSAINRRQTRDEAIEILRGIAESPESLPNAVEEALASIADIAAHMEAEANIETLVKAKGFEECVAVIADGKCSVVVKGEGLLAEEVAQILEIAMAQSGMPATSINIAER